ncbi:hypothetical protein [Anaerotignum sp.]|uniref:hypothetical protein n=1 Tax=Anaerotignum sp. TaxID=2039241 RepID=UPI00289A21BE|nr:hypothetical protein [Anaerotignum sp.]
MDTINWILIAVCIILVILSIIFNVNYMDCTNIIKKHMDFLKNDDGKYLMLPVITYYFVPLIISIIAIRSGATVNKEFAESMIVIISILISSFFMIITCILSMKPIFVQNKKLSALQYENINCQIKESSYTVIFEIFISFIIVLLCVVSILQRILKAYF